MINHLYRAIEESDKINDDNVSSLLKGGYVSDRTSDLSLICELIMGLEDDYVNRSLAITSEAA